MKKTILILIALNGCIFDKISQEYRYEVFPGISAKDTVIGKSGNDTIHGMVKYSSDSMLFENYFYQVIENAADADFGHRIYFITPSNFKEHRITINENTDKKIFYELLCDECLSGFKEVIEGDISISSLQFEYKSEGWIKVKFPTSNNIKKIEIHGTYKK